MNFVGHDGITEDLYDNNDDMTMCQLNWETVSER